MGETATTAKRESKDCRREAIGRAAIGLIAERGLEGLRTRDIAARVGINIATLHYHVPTKEALIGLVAGMLRERFKEQTLARPRAHLPGAAQLEHEFADFREIATEESEVIAVFSELMDRSRRDADIAAALLPMFQRWKEIVARIFEQGRLDGSLRADIDPVAAAQIMVGTLLTSCRGGGCTADAYQALCAELRRAFGAAASGETEK